MGVRDVLYRRGLSPTTTTRGDSRCGPLTPRCAANEVPPTGLSFSSSSVLFFLPLGGENCHGSESQPSPWILAVAPSHEPRAPRAAPPSKGPTVGGGTRSTSNSRGGAAGGPRHSPTTPLTVTRGGRQRGRAAATRRRDGWIHTPPREKCHASVASQQRAVGTPVGGHPPPAAKPSALLGRGLNPIVGTRLVGGGAAGAATPARAAPPRGPSAHRERHGAPNPCGGPSLRPLSLLENVP